MGDESPSRKRRGVCGVSAKAPLVSVMMPVFNGAKTAVWAIASVIAQTVEDWEVIVVDDGSADGTCNSIRSIGHPQIRVYRFEENRGRGAARQFALENCRGEFLAMLDADDWWYPWKLDRQLRFLEENPEIGVVSSAMTSVGGGGNIRGIWRPTGERLGVTISPPLRSLFNTGVPCAPCLIRRDVVGDASYEPRLRRAEDFHFLAQILRRTSHAILPDPLYAYSDVPSFAREGAVTRYLWSARACLMLTREFPLGGVNMAVREFAQVLGALVRLRGTATLDEPDAKTVEQFEEARRQVQDWIPTC